MQPLTHSLAMGITVNVLRPRLNGPYFAGATFKLISFKKDLSILEFHWNLILKVQLLIYHGLDGRLAPKRWKAIIWTNDGIVYWRVYIHLAALVS